MSVLSYLQTRASQAVLSTTENTSINTSISTLATRLNYHFGANVSSHFRFGSSTRGTILPRAMDDHSDIDYMVVFAQGGYSPQTYIDRLREFAETYYSTSDIKQSSPTIVLQLNHIKFDLVPALAGYWPGVYQIPNGPTAWRDTNPNDFNAKLTAKNQAELNLIKPTIRLAKFWNARNGYVYDSYGFEKWIVEQSYYFDNNQKAYLFSVFDKLGANEAAAWRNEKINRAKQIIAKVREYEADNMPFTAESEIKKLIPE
ncbi:nucleotidyltransferase [uncultured Sphingomonas sp.]|uniref:SMODS domain-containing nucleotidyltransferase n=1 Tax=uncultured Sphingomonas sp. TaxID=158754 RepID=UPI0025FB4E35|nr:nucleotidyltransferase [uncultured Sphingomonas sp.]